MQINGSVIGPIPRFPAERQVSGERVAVEQVPASSAGTAASNLTLNAVTDAKRAEAMLFKNRHDHSTQQLRDAVDDARSQRAVTAYTSLEQNAEREYVSAVLGIDEYV